MPRQAAWILAYRGGEMMLFQKHVFFNVFLYAFCRMDERSVIRRM